MQNAKLSGTLFLIALLLIVIDGDNVLFSQPTVELEKVFSAEDKVNAPLDIAVNVEANRAYVVEQDGDILEITLTEQWQVANVKTIITLENPSALTLSKDKQTLFVANGPQVVLIDLSSEITRRLQTANVFWVQHRVVAISTSEQEDALLLATSHGDILRLSLSKQELVNLGYIEDPVSDLLYDPKRQRVYVSTQRGTVLTFDPEQKTSERLSFVGPPLGNMDLQDNNLFVTSVDFGLYKIDLNSPESTAYLFFPRVAGPSSIVVQKDRALVTNVGEGLVLLDPLDFSGPLASTFQIILSPALGPVHSLVIERERRTAFLSDRGNTLWSLTTDPIDIASFVFTPFDGRVSLHPEENKFFATNRPGGQVLAMPFDPPFRFTFDMPAISPLIASGLPHPDGVTYLATSNTIFVGTLEDGALWQVYPDRFQAERVTFLPQGATSIDVENRQGMVFILLNQTDDTGMGMLLKYNPDTQELTILHDRLPQAVDMAVDESCVYLASETNDLLFTLSSDFQLKALALVPQLSAVTKDQNTVYLGNRQGELFLLKLQDDFC